MEFLILENYQGVLQNHRKHSKFYQRMKFKSIKTKSVAMALKTYPPKF